MPSLLVELPPGTADDVIAAMVYENSRGIAGRPRGHDVHASYVFYASAPVDAGEAVAAVSLATGGSI